MMDYLLLCLGADYQREGKDGNHHLEEELD
jgi:hypothetical protein